MHYLLIIKIKGGINKPERKGTFVLSQARFPVFCYPTAWMFVSLGQQNITQCPFGCGAGSRVGEGREEEEERGHAVARTRLGVG